MDREVITCRPLNERRVKLAIFSLCDAIMSETVDNGTQVTVSFMMLMHDVLAIAKFLVS